MNLPGYLKPQDGKFRLEDATTLWGIVHYGIAVDTPETPEVKRLRQRAQREVAAVASKEIGPILYNRTPIPPQRGGQESTRGVSYICLPKIWVTAPAMAGLFQQHGHPYPWGPEAEPAHHPVSAGLPGRPSTNAEAYRYIETLMAAGSKQLPACLDAASKFFPDDDCQKKAETLAAGFRQYRKRP